MPVGVIGAVASVAGGIAQAGAASDAADAQSAAAERELQLQRDIYEETSANFDPYRQGGGLGFQAYLAEMGLADAPMIGGTAPEIVAFSETMPGTPTTPTGVGSQGGLLSGGGFNGFMSPLTPTSGPGSIRERFRVGSQIFDTREAAEAYAQANTTGGRAFGGFQETPGYQFQLGRGMDALNSSNAARGNLLSGANIAGAMQFGQGLASQEYNNYLNRLQGIGQQGQAAAGNQAAAGQAYAAGAGNALAGIGNAQAAGAIGTGNAIQGGINNFLGTMGYLNTQTPGGIFGGNTAAGSTRPPGNPYY